jgi:acetyl esterase/lipase
LYATLWPSDHSVLETNAKGAMHKGWKTAAALMGVLLSACSPVSVLNLAVPRSGYHVVRDLAYGGDPRQKLDLYIPDAPPSQMPVILFFYGGSWESGSKDLYLALGQAFASKGIMVAVADYRLYPQVRYPAFVQDGAQAFAYVHAHAAHYGGDPGRLFLAGHSAGAYNAMMLAADTHYLRDAGADISQVCGVIGIAGPYNFLPLRDDHLIAIFGGADRQETQPITYIDGKRPPMLLAAGTGDTTVSPRNSSDLAEKLRSFGSPVRLVKYPGVGHIGIILSLAPGFRGRTSLRSDIIQFVESAAAGCGN